MLSETDKAWLACAIDSEGSIAWRHISSGGRYTYPKRPTISVYNTDRRFLAKVSLLTGKASISWRSNGYGKKRLYSCQIQRHKLLVKLLEAIIPYLIIKRSKAEQMLKWLYAHPPMHRDFTEDSGRL